MFLKLKNILSCFRFIPYNYIFYCTTKNAQNVWYYELVDEEPFGYRVAFLRIPFIFYSNNVILHL